MFNQEKLDWMNAEYIKALPVDEYLRRLSVGGFLPEGVMQERAARVVQERLVKLSDATELIGEAVEVAAYEMEALVWKKSDAKEAK